MLARPSVASTDAKRDRSPVRVTQRELIELAGPAHLLSLETLRVRARQGGEYLSPLLGRGMEFDEARPYQPGDDPRNIDWKVTARTGKPYTKVFREERERPVLFMLDLRHSMHFATQGVFKAVQAARLATLLAWAADNNGDRVGGFLFSEDFHRELKPRLGKRSVLRLIHEIVNAPNWGSAAAATGDPERAAEQALAGVRKVEKSGSLLVLISDGRNLNDVAGKLLAGLGRNNDLLIFNVFDPLEVDLPPPGHYSVISGQTRRAFSINERQQRQSYVREFEKRRELLRGNARHPHTHYFEVSTTADPVAELQATFGRRRR